VDLFLFLLFILGFVHRRVPLPPIAIR
jgi:hypothetical protein